MINIQDNTYLIEIVTEDKNSNNHCIYQLNKNGEIIQNTKITNTPIKKILPLIKHMHIIHFNVYEMWEMQCKTMYNRIFEPDIIPYDNTQAWQMTPVLIKIITHLSKIMKVEKYTNTLEYGDNEKTLRNFIYQPQTQIEEKSKNIHQQAISSRTRMIQTITEWIQ